MIGPVAGDDDDDWQKSDNKKSLTLTSSEDILL